MKLSTLLLATSLLFSMRLFALPDSAQAYKDLQREREKALAAAAEPVNRRYVTALGDLLKRATQTNDLDTAVAVRAEILRMGGTVTSTGLPSMPAVTDEGKRAALRAQLRDTKWNLGGGRIVTFHADGSTSGSWHHRRGTWKVVAPNTAEATYTNSGVMKKLVFDADGTSASGFSDNGVVSETWKKQ